MKFKQYFWILYLFLIVPILSDAQSILQESKARRTNLHSPEHKTLPTAFRLLEINTLAIDQSLDARQNSDRCIDIPMPNGSDECFVLEKAEFIPSSLPVINIT